MLATDEMRAWYGPDHVQLATDRGAVGTLLISDELFRFVGTPELPTQLCINSLTARAIPTYEKNMCG